MADDYSKSKFLPPDEAGNPGQTYPENATQSPFQRLEPLITPDLLIQRHLFGIPLVSRFKDPLTQKPMRMTNDMLKDYINQSVNECEALCSIDIFPVKYHEKQPYSKPDFEQFGYFKLKHKPVHSLDAMTVQLADESEIFVFPNEWIETSNLTYGQVNIIPLGFSNLGTGTGIIGVPSRGTAVYFNNLWNRSWVAALFGFSYTTGFLNGQLPIVVNELIGVVAAINILSMLAATWARVTSTSLGLDGMSQAISVPGPQIWTVRIGELKERRDELMKKIRKLFGQLWNVGDV